MYLVYKHCLWLLQHFSITVTVKVNDTESSCWSFLNEHKKITLLLICTDRLCGYDTRRTPYLQHVSHRKATNVNKLLKSMACAAKRRSPLFKWHKSYENADILCRPIHRNIHISCVYNSTNSRPKGPKLIINKKAVFIQRHKSRDAEALAVSGKAIANPLKCTGVRQLHFKVFSAIQV